MLRSKVAIITGASRGLGRAIALRFAQNGASVVLMARGAEGLERVAAEVRALDQNAYVYAGDVADPANAARVTARALECFGAIDILVNVAGIITRTPVEDLSLDDWFRVIDVNLHGTFHMCRAVLPHMRQQRSGKIINMTSQMARRPHPGASPSYEVSKAGLMALTRHLALQYAPYNICVNAIAPGSIDTDLPKSMSAEARALLKSGIPMKRLGEPEEVGDGALFLASSMSSYITGTTLDINGGSLML